MRKFFSYVLCGVMALALPASGADPYVTDPRPADPAGEKQAPEARKPDAPGQAPATSATPPRDRGSRDGEPPAGDTVPGGPSAGVRDPKPSDAPDKPEGVGGAGSTGGKTY